MSQAAASQPLDLFQLGARYYNATIEQFHHLHDDLAILRVRPDGGPLSYEAGQYTVLGLGNWEPRLEGTQEEVLAAQDQARLVRRAYSISSSVVDDRGCVTRATSQPLVEFYIALVRRTDGAPPALTPRIFTRRAGDRIYLARHCHGHYTTEGVRPDDQVVFLATGTGEAPHNAMLADLLAGGHRAPIVSVVCARYAKDFGYESIHRRLEQRYTNYHYITLTTREPWNIDSTHAAFIGKQYIQQFVASGQLEATACLTLEPETTHVFLCGNPSMIGLPVRTSDGTHRYPTPAGMVEILERRGFVVDRPHHRGRVHFEKYW